MPIWGWLCIGLLGVAASLWLLFEVFVMRPYNRQQALLRRDGQTVVAWVLLANPSVYKSGDPPNFEFAFVVFTLDNDPSEQHLSFLQTVAGRLDRFKADKGDPDERKLAWAVSTQRTIGDVLRVPDRLTGGRAVYFSTPGVNRRMLPEGRLTRGYIHLRALVDGPNRAASMVEYPGTTVGRDDDR